MIKKIKLYSFVNKCGGVSYVKYVIAYNILDIKRSSLYRRFCGGESIILTRNIILKSNLNLRHFFGYSPENRSCITELSFKELIECQKIYSSYYPHDSFGLSMLELIMINWDD